MRYLHPDLRYIHPDLRYIHSDLRYMKHNLAKLNQALLTSPASSSFRVTKAPACDPHVPIKTPLALTFKKRPRQP